jgi:two-component system repressor protein LuxO
MVSDHLLKNHVTKEGKSFERFSDNAKAQLLAYDWPGNVRELQNVIQKAVVLNHGKILNSAMLSLNISKVVNIEHEIGLLDYSPKVTNVESLKIPIEPLWLVEKRTIECAIKKCAGNVNKAAGLLEVAPSTIYRKLQSWENKNLIADASS